MKLPPVARSLLVVTAAVSLAGAELPHIHDINLYGLHKVSADRVLRAAKVRAGDPLPGSKGDMEDAINQIPGVVKTEVQAVCCEGPDVILFIGIEERGVAYVGFRSDPGGSETLPEDLIAAYREYADAVRRAAPNQAVADTGGWQRQFSTYAGAHTAELRQVLRDAGDPEQRAAAAAVLAFAAKKQSTVDDLQYALQDPDDSVRGAALRSLRTMALADATRPALGLRIAPTWLIELLHSVSLDDRMQSIDILLTLTDKGNRSVLDEVRTRALPDLAEMARWETLRYALPPFLLVGRIAGLKDAEIQKRWSEGQREPVIAKALGRRGGKRAER